MEKIPFLMGKSTGRSSINWVSTIQGVIAADITLKVVGQSCDEVPGGSPQDFFSSAWCGLLVGS